MNERSQTRQRIIAATAGLLQSRGREAVTTRAVSAAASVQPPTIYRLFSDMDGLLEAVASDGFAAYLAQKQDQTLTDDPVEDLRHGWDLHLQFGLDNPAQYLLVYGQPVPGRRSAAADQALRLLQMLVERVAVSGRLVVRTQVAVDLLFAAGVGATLSLIGTAPEERDLKLSSRMREAILAAFTTARPVESSDAARRAVALKAVLDDAPVRFTAGERALLDELLDRVADQVTSVDTPAVPGGAPGP